MRRSQTADSCVKSASRRRLNSPSSRPDIASFVCTCSSPYLSFSRLLVVSGGCVRGPRLLQPLLPDRFRFEISLLRLTSSVVHAPAPAEPIDAAPVGVTLMLPSSAQIGFVLRKMKRSFFLCLKTPSSKDRKLAKLRQSTERSPPPRLRSPFVTVEAPDSLNIW